MGYATCRKCNGSGNFYDRKSGKNFNCRACGGSGSNKSLWTTRCERCRTEIVYKANTPTPKFCKSCRNIELTKTCAQPGCNNTIKYKVGWIDVRDYCGSCHNKRQKGFSASTCPGTSMFGCGKVVWSPPGKRFTHCHECSERKRAEEAAKWKTKRCQGCGGEIRYNVDWDKVPDYCKACNQWQYKTCDSSGCNNQIKFKKYWDNPPNYCPDCKKKQKSRIKAGDLFRAGLIPRGWRAEAEDIDIKEGHITMFFRDKGTNGKGYRVSWDGFGEAHWTDEGLDKNHPHRHRDPRK